MLSNLPSSSERLGRGTFSEQNDTVNIAIYYPTLPVITTLSLRVEEESLYPFDLDFLDRYLTNRSLTTPID